MKRYKGEIFLLFLIKVLNAIRTVNSAQVPQTRNVVYVKWDFSCFKQNASSIANLASTKTQAIRWIHFVRNVIQIAKTAVVP